MYFSFDLLLHILDVSDNIQIFGFEFAALFFEQWSTRFILKINFLEHIISIDFSLHLKIFMWFRLFPGRTHWLHPWWAIGPIIMLKWWPIPQPAECNQVLVTGCLNVLRILLTPIVSIWHAGIAEPGCMRIGHLLVPFGRWNVLAGFVFLFVVQTAVEKLLVYH